MTVYLVGAGPGDPGLITCRGRDLLAQADVVLYDRLVDRGLLAGVRAEAIVYDAGKQPGQADRQAELNKVLVGYGRAHDTVVRLKGGDPLVFGRGGEEVEALIDAGVEVEIVPGVTSAIGVLTAAGIPATYRGLARSFTVVTGHTGKEGERLGAGLYARPERGRASAREPHGAGDDPDWTYLARLKGTLIVLMGVENRAEIASRLIEGGRSGATPVVAVENGTTPRCRTVHTTLDHLAGEDLEAPAVIAIGETAAFKLVTPKLYPLAGLSVVTTRARTQGESLNTMLREAGAEVIEFPVISFNPPDDDGLDLKRHVAWVGRYDWVVFTSVNAVERFFSLLRDARDLGGVRIAAVGDVTAKALLSLNIQADTIPQDDQSVRGLIEIMPAPGPVSGRNETGRVLYPKAAGAAPTLAKGLRQKGWLVDEVEAYKTVPATHDAALTPELIDMVKRADAIIFASPSAVSAYFEIVKDGRAPSVVACIGDTTASAVRQSGLAVDVVAADQSVEGLVDGLVSLRKRMKS
ncbi:MAG: uroporphyrinogen-III C-methyltransferase [Acidimicrobiales bacterium]